MALFYFKFKNYMAKIAVIKTGGKQYCVEAGSVIKVEKLSADIGATVKLDTLLIADGSEVEVGTPSLGEKVEVKILEHDKADKVSVVKYKNKTRYTRNVGHRQPFTKIEISKF